MNELEYIINKTLYGTSDSDKHLLPLYSLVIASNAKNIIELGTRHATTALPLIMGAEKTGGFVYTVDIMDCSHDINKMVSERFKPFYEFVHQDAILFLQNWDPKKSIDLIFIDDWHSYEHVKKELEIINGLVSTRTIILLHDLMYETDPEYHSDLNAIPEFGNGGPCRAVFELDPKIWEFSTLPWNNGLTILRKKLIIL